VRAACGLADLVRAQAERGPDDLLAFTARLLGYVRVEPIIQPTRAAKVSACLVSAHDAPGVGAQPAMLQAPFWRLDIYVPFEDGREGSSPLSLPEADTFEVADDKNLVSVPVEPAKHLPLSSWPALLTRLRALATERRETGAVDVNAVVGQLSNGQLPSRLPRKRHRRWGPQVQVVRDRSDHLIPYWHDQDLVSRQVGRLFPRNSVEFASYCEGGFEPRFFRPTAVDVRYRIPPTGTLVLILGDLGCLSATPQEASLPWLRLGRRLHRATVRPVALTPCPPGRWLSSLMADWCLIPWEQRVGSAMMSSEELMARRDRLLRLVSPAVRLEPGLLRDIRHLLGPADADAGTEADVWQHPALLSNSAVGATLVPETAKLLRREFLAAEDAHRRNVVLAVRRWRAGLERIWLEEIASVEAEWPELLSRGDKTRLARGIRQLLTDLEHVSAAQKAAARDWLIGMWQRLPDGAWVQAGLEPFQEMWWNIHRHEPDATLPAGFDPTRGHTGNPIQRLSLGQCGNNLLITAMNTVSLESVIPVSPVAEVESRNLLISFVDDSRRQDTIIGSQSADKDRTRLWGGFDMVDAESAEVRRGRRSDAEVLRLQNGTSSVRWRLPPGGRFLLRTDCAQLVFAQVIKPAWATRIGRDRFGLWADMELVHQGSRPALQRLRWIPPGRFQMGSPDGEPGRWEDEGPQHFVTISRGFWLFDTPCTQTLWTAVMGNNPSRFKSSERPVERVSWNDVQEFLTRIKELVPGGWVLPTEAQWEYACRAGTGEATYSGRLEISGERCAPRLDAIAWYGGNSGVGFELDNGYDSSGWPQKQYPHERAGTRSVRLKQPNGWGLYDMLGNVLEWCADGQRHYLSHSVVDPVGPMEYGVKRAQRGGSWDVIARYARSADRDSNFPRSRNDNFGFRCARVEEDGDC
jgi:formylglycine-generating enzyme required for sulfatase activity